MVNRIWRLRFPARWYKTSLSGGEKRDFSMSKLILASLLVLGVTAFAEKPEYCGNYPPDRSPLECRDGDDSQVVIIEDDGTVGEVPEICKLGYFTEDTLPEECRGFDAPELPSAIITLRRKRG